MKSAETGWGARIAIAAALMLAVLGAVPGVSQANHGSIMVDATDPNYEGPPVAFFVTGFGGCCYPHEVIRWLTDDMAAAGVVVHKSYWNDILDDSGNTIEPNGDPGVFDITKPFGGSPNPYSDEAFIGQMIAAINGLPPSSPVILIGHSFGGDALLQVAKRVGARRIAFLGTLDPVGRGGLRANVTRPVASNVDYFFSRWQSTNPFPLENLWYAADFLLPGLSILVWAEGQVVSRLESDAVDDNQAEANFERTATCQTKYRDSLHLVPQILGHMEFPSDSCIQEKVKDLLHRRVLNPNPRVIDDEPVAGSNPTLLAGVKLTFSKQIDPLTFGVGDVVEAPSAVTAVESVPGSNDRQFIVRFAEFDLALRDALTPNTIRLVVGPSILDVAGHPLDQDLDLIAGELVQDQYTVVYAAADDDTNVPLPVDLPPAILHGAGNLADVVVLPPQPEIRNTTILKTTILNTTTISNTTILRR
jgi:hypothetical protein